MTRRDESYDIVVCGGGLAGLCAAIAAARLGRRTCLVHDRPGLGGNALRSSWSAPFTGGTA